MAASVINSKNTSGTNKTTHTLSARVRKTIQSIKEIVGNFSDADIYMVLKETNMDPNETAQKLLNQDPFHEVKRKRDKKKETVAYMGTGDSRTNSENVDQETKSRTFSNHKTKSRTFSNHNTRQGGYTRAAVLANAGINKEFRVVRDNRVDLNTNREPKPSSKQGSASSNEQIIAIVAEKGSTRTSSNVKHLGLRSSTQVSNEPIDLQSRHPGEATSNFTCKKVTLDEKQAVVPTATSHMQVKPSSQHHSVTQASSNSVVGVYSSSMDPVHVPSLESRSSAAVGAIKREVGVVGGRRQSSENAVKISSASSTSFSNSGLGRDDLLLDSFQPFPTISKTDQDNQKVTTESAIHSISVSRPFIGNYYSRPHQTSVGHQKASQHNKEWRPKSSQKSSVGNSEAIGTPTKSGLPPSDGSKVSESAATDLQDKLSQLNINKNQNVIIAKHIQLPEIDRCRLNFGSFGVELDSSRNIQSGGFQAAGVTEDFKAESATSLSVSTPESSSDDASGNKQVDISDDHVRNSGSDSPASAAVSEHPSPDKSSSPNLDNYAAVGLTRDNSPFIPSETQHQLDSSELSSFSAYDPQGSYDISYFRPAIDETVREQGLPSTQKALTPHAVNSMPNSSIPMVQQQQQPPVAQMYPQIHVPHFTNVMPYRQFLSPVYVPQVAMPGYSSNPAYPHLSNGSSYLLMPGGSSHLSANGLKYGIQQFKPVHGSSPAGFGNFASPTGYAINAPSVVGSATGLEDSSRIKYKDGNLYVPNPQAETSEIWVQNPRELPGLQSASYYNMPGQSPHAAFLPSHAAHASFNTAAAQSSHMQFSGLYPPPPPTPAAMANPHHLGPVMGNNVGVGVAAAAPGAQVGGYQQPQLGHLNWTTTNF